MKVDGPALDDWLKEVPLEELDDQHESKGGEPDLPASIGERDENGDEAGEKRADERYECADENQDGEGERHRHSEQPEAEPD